MQDLVELGVSMAAEEFIERGKDRFLVGKARERNSTDPSERRAIFLASGQWCFSCRKRVSSSSEIG